MSYLIHELEYLYIELAEGKAGLAGFCPILKRAVQKIEAQEEEIEKMRVALQTLAAWDMLTLDGDGKGQATQDAPWAVQMIREALERE